MKDFSNPDYQPKDFGELRRSELGNRLETMRLADKIRRLLECKDSKAAADKLEKMTTELETLRAQKETINENII